MGLKSRIRWFLSFSLTFMTQPACSVVGGDALGDGSGEVSEDVQADDVEAHLPKLRYVVSMSAFLSPLNCRLLAPGTVSSGRFPGIPRPLRLSFCVSTSSPGTCSKPTSGNIVRAVRLSETFFIRFPRLIKAADEFVSSAPFANLSRCDPELFAVDGAHRLCWSNPRRNCVGIMLGSVATCNLGNPHNYNTNVEGGYIVRKITITPPEMTLRRFAAFLGTKFRWGVLKAPVDGGNEITFSTRKKGAGGEFPSISLCLLVPTFACFCRWCFWIPRTWEES